MRHVHGEATECVMFIGRAWTEQPMETRPGVLQNGGNGLVFDRPHLKRDPVHREGSGIPQNGGNGPPTVETGVLLIGRGVAYRKTDETDLCWSATVETGVLFIGRGVAYRKTGLHGILFISIVDRLQLPQATVHPLSTSSSLHLRLFIHGLLFIQPSPLLHRLLFNQPSTSYCSTSPPRGHPVHPALHGACSSTGSVDRGTVHPAATASTTTGSCSSNPRQELFIQTPQQRSLFIQRQHRSASVSSSREGIARSGLVNSH